MSITQLWGVPIYKESTELTLNNFNKENTEYQAKLQLDLKKMK